tara:strand:+ start:798 stop:1067 length:270 start_codon:yes stop_codon:yes gene_type:complete
MTISKRCTTFNLLNHCKQVKKHSILRYKFIKRKDYDGPEIKNNLYYTYPDSWICKFELNDYIYYDCSYSKRQSLENILISLDEDLRTTH